MLDFFGLSTHHDSLTTAYEWRWAFQYPYLFTIIKVSPTAIVVLAGVRIVWGLFNRRKV